MGPALARTAAERSAPELPAQYQGLNFYGSYNPGSPSDRSLHRWATTVVDRFQGVSVSIVPRQRRRSPPDTHKAVQAQPHVVPAPRKSIELSREKRAQSSSVAWVPIRTSSRASSRRFL